MDLFILGLLILLNGLFSLSEIALVSARKARLEHLAEKGNKRAQIALELSNHPEFFLSAVQIGITLISILTGVYSGEKFSANLLPYLKGFGIKPELAETLSTTLIVIFVTFLSIIFGELIPKRIGLLRAEKLAMATAGPMKMFARLTYPIVWLLNESSSLFFKLFKIRKNLNDAITEEEIKTLITEGTEAGTIEEEEQEIIERVFHLSDRNITSLMTHRSDIIWFDENEIEEEIKEKIIDVDESVTSEKNDIIPSWVKNNAGWWADGQISENDFLSGIKHLVKTGIISISTNSLNSVSESDSIVSESDSIVSECQSIKSTYKRLNCEKEIKQNIEFMEFKKISFAYVVGPITYYYPGIGNLGNEFEISSSGQAMLRLRILAENNGSDVVSLKCTGPSICNYDVWDGSKAFKYAGMDFVSGQIPINPGTSVIFNMMFGPNIGYGGNQFEYDSSKNYDFRVNENFGSIVIPLKIE